MAVTQAIPADVLAVLRESRIDSNCLYLPARQLDRKLYEAVNKVLTNAGGKWNRGKKAHVFASDPTTELGLALETGVTINKQQLFQSFYTPAELAETVARLADVSGHVVLEPSAGHGALADACRAAGATSVICIDINPDAVAALRSFGYTATEIDFLTFKNVTDKPFTRIVMNPPFTRGADIKHVKHALTMLAPGGKLVAIMADRGDENCEKIINECTFASQYEPDSPEWYQARLDYPITYKFERLGRQQFEDTTVATMILTIQRLP
jgi:predicted RNA methylase